MPIFTTKCPFRKSFPRRRGNLRGRRIRGTERPSAPRLLETTTDRADSHHHIRAIDRLDSDFPRASSSSTPPIAAPLVAIAQRTTRKIAGGARLARLRELRQRRLDCEFPIAWNDRECENRPGALQLREARVNAIGRHVAIPCGETKETLIHRRIGRDGRRCDGIFRSEGPRFPCGTEGWEGGGRRVKDIAGRSRGSLKLEWKGESPSGYQPSWRH